ncbi:hypothetical protein FRX31_035423 [Thalictrum thalictroides]|uniref:Uncharacterized protein n=1 Tax=Thalictrum thalictroides TaxID=46969 RepID=A0A7J6URU0_THATH|nr:hypothetical protein FRX31_035423 [Thalictrum thalictroides]
MASNCQAFFVTPDGTGTNHRITPVAIEANNGFNEAPCHGSTGTTVFEVDDARTAKLRFGKEVVEVHDFKTMSFLNGFENEKADFDLTRFWIWLWIEELVMKKKV